jgi:hypothetical protein
VGFLSGLTVHQIRIGYDLRLVVSDAKWLDENNAEVVIEGPCLVTEPGGAESRVRLADPDSIPSLLRLQSRIIGKVSAEGGTLRAVLDDESALAVPPLDEYEAWRIEGPGDSLVVCMPGGELAF